MPATIFDNPHTDPEYRRPVSGLIPGDVLDLEHDEIADPNKDSPLYEFEYATVVGTEQETPGCIRVDLEGASVGFPPNHTVRWVGFDPETAAALAEK